MMPAPPPKPWRLDLSWWVLGAALLLIGLLIGYYVFADYRRTEQAARESLQAQVGSLGAELQRRLESINAAMVDVRDSVPFWAAQKDGPDLANRHLNALSHALEGARTMSILDATGTMVASNRREVIGKNFADRDYFQVARDDRNATKLYLSSPRKSVLGVDVMLLVKSRLGPDGAFQGVVVTALDPDNFKLLLEGVRSTPDTLAGIAHGRGKKFLVVPETMSQFGAQAKQLAPPASQQQRSGQLLAESGGGTTERGPQFVAHKTVQPTGLSLDFPLVVSVERNPRDIFSAWRTQVYGLAGFFMVLALLSALGLWQVQRRQILLRRAADALAESNQRFAAFFDSAMVGMAVASAEKCWLEVNPALCEMLGYDREALIGKSGATLTHLDDQAIDAAQFERLTLGEINDYRLEKRYIRSNADIVHAFVSVRAVRGADHRIDFLTVVIEDITMRKQAELKTGRALQLMQSFIDHWPGLAYIKDRDARVVMANQAFRALGLDPAQLVGKTGQEVLPGALSDKIARDDARVMLNGKAELVADEYGGRHYESRRFVIDDQAGERLLGGLTMDVTRRHRSVQRVEALLAINEKGGALAERLTASPIAFLYFVNEDRDTEALVLSTHARQSGRASLAVQDAMRHAGGWADCVHQKKTLVFNDDAARRTSKGLPEVNVPLTRLVLVPVVDERKVRLLVGMANKSADYDNFDVETAQLIGNDLWRIVRRMRVEVMLQQRLSELSAIYLKLADAQGQLLQSEKLSAIGQLAAGVAHEINNPIGFVQSNLRTLSDYVADLMAIDRAYADLEGQLTTCEPQVFARVHALKRECGYDFIQRDMAQLLRESGEGLERVTRIVQDLKGFSRVGETGWQWADLLAGLESTLNILRSEIKYKAEVVRELVSLPQVRCIASQINQVFLNLLLNACQAIATQGQITLRSGRDGDFVWIEVQDNGCGIAPENKARIFEPFYTSKPVGKGTGLGLSLAWGIVQHHQGTIELLSEPGRGSTFRVRLPIAGPTTDNPVVP